MEYFSVYRVENGPGSVTEDMILVKQRTDSSEPVSVMVVGGKTRSVFAMISLTAHLIFIYFDIVLNISAVSCVFTPVFLLFYLTF